MGTLNVEGNVLLYTDAAGESFDGQNGIGEFSLLAEVRKVTRAGTSLHSYPENAVSKKSPRYMSNDVKRL